jgi:hypothetical protein
MSWTWFWVMMPPTIVCCRLSFEAIKAPLAPDRHTRRTCRRVNSKLSAL